MNTFYKYLPIVFLFLVACGQPTLEDKKAELSKLKETLKSTQTEIDQLSEEIAKLEPAKVAIEKGVLVTTVTVAPGNFTHKIEARGNVASKKNVNISALASGEIIGIKVKEGQYVQKGQVLLTIDSKMINSSISQVQANLELAEAVYTRQERLWKQEIGTEVQFLTAKANKESLPSQMRVLKTQRDQTIIKAPFSGLIDMISAKVGEIASPANPNPLVRMVSPSSVYVEADLSERYLGVFKKGDVVELLFPILNESVKAKISSVGSVINQANRTFAVEIDMPSNTFKVNPNQVVKLKLTDYASENSIVVPSEVVFANGSDKFIYKVESKTGKMIAKKQFVKVGKTFNGKTEIIEGLNASDMVLVEGARNVSDGSKIMLSSSKNAKG